MTNSQKEFNMSVNGLSLSGHNMTLTEIEYFKIRNKYVRISPCPDSYVEETVLITGLSNLPIMELVAAGVNIAISDKILSMIGN